MVSPSVKLPSIEELTVDEINVSSPLFRAIGPYLGYACDDLGKVKSLHLLHRELLDPRLRMVANDAHISHLFAHLLPLIL